MTMVARRLRGRLREQDGFTLVELVAVVAILGIILGGLTQLFTSGTNSELDQNSRVQAQQQARVGLDRLRREARCASATTMNSASSITLTLPGQCTRTTLASALHIAPGGLTSATTITVGSTVGFASGSNTISFANSDFQTTVACTGTTTTTFTGCTGGDGGASGGSGEDYSVGAIVTNTTSSSVTWCVPASGSGSTMPYSLERFTGACGAASAGTLYAQYLVSSSIFSEAVVPVAAVTTASSGGSLGAGTYFYDVTAVLSSGVEVPGTLTSSISTTSGTTNENKLTWSAYTGAASYNVYGRDNSGLRLIANTTSLSYTDTGPLTTTLTDDPLTLPSATIDVASTTGFLKDPNTGDYGIEFGPSGSVNCTGVTSTSFTGCSGGTTGSYLKGMTVYSASTVRPPNLTLGVTLQASTRYKNPAATSAFTLTDNVALRNSRPY